MNALLQKFALIFIALVFSASALALTLQEAKSQGKVGELPSGYLGVVKSAPKVNELVKSVNAKRKQHYLKIARKNNIQLAQVAARAGERNLQKTAAGHYIQNSAGQWVKK